MDIVKEINRVRRLLFTEATKSIVKKADISQITDVSSIKKILVCRPNQRLGNLLLLTPLLQEIESVFPEAQVDLIVKGGLAHKLYEEYPNINQIYPLPKKPFMQLISYLNVYFKATNTHYDLVINATDDSSSGRIITKNSNGNYKLYGNPEFVYWGDRTDSKHIAKKPILALRKLLQINRSSCMPMLDLRLSEDELRKGRQLLNNMLKNNQKTLCLFTYATGDKIYAKDWWHNLYLEMKLNFNDYNIVEILPIENVSQIDFKAPTFYSKDIRELAAVMAACELFVGADSGIMHLSSAAGVPTLGLFKVTDIEMYRPYNHNSLAINTRESNLLSIINQIKSILKLNHT